MKIKACMAAIFLLVIICMGCEDPYDFVGQVGDVTDKIEELGNPLKDQYADGTPRVYARNIWDMHAFNGKIYFGGGNSSNSAPASNVGPGRLWSYHPVNGFVMEYQTRDEQVHLIREFDGELYLPGHDPQESWDWGNFYRLSKLTNKWIKYRTIIAGIHVYDVYKWGKHLFAGTGPGTGARAIQVSHDNGLSWENAQIINSPIIDFRIYGLFPMNGRLYFTTGNSLAYYSGRSNIFIGHSSAERIRFGVRRVERAVIFNDYTVFLNCNDTNDHQYLPIDLRAAKDVSSCHILKLPSGAVPRDLMVRDGYLYALVTYKNADDCYKNAVLVTWSAASTDVDWLELFHFTKSTYARSFERIGDSYYFGLGCDVWTGGTSDSAPPTYLHETGNILRYVHTGHMSNGVTR